MCSVKQWSKDKEGEEKQTEHEFLSQAPLTLYWVDSAFCVAKGVVVTWANGTS